MLNIFFFLMIQPPTRSTRTDTLVPYTPLFRSTRTHSDHRTYQRRADDGRRNAHHRRPAGEARAEGRGVDTVSFLVLREEEGVDAGLDLPPQRVRGLRADERLLVSLPSDDRMVAVELNGGTAQRQIVVAGRRGCFSDDLGGGRTIKKNRI